MSEDEWWEGREYGGGAEENKKIKTDQAVFTMTCLNFVLDEINPLVFLHLDKEGWKAYALCGDREALHGVNDTCFVFCEVWDERDRKRRHLALRDADGSRPPKSSSSLKRKHIFLS